MNVFYLDRDPTVCAQMHCDKHVVKMIIEYAQLLSTAHRILDGVEYEGKTQTGRRVRRWKLSDPSDEKFMYKASHINHPSAVWARANDLNYIWLLEMWYALCYEYEHRYGREHLTFTKLADVLNRVPENIPDGMFYEPTPAMPDYCKLEEGSLESYRNYYIKEKTRFAKWTKRSIPTWFTSESTECQPTLSKTLKQAKSGKSIARSQSAMSFLSHTPTLLQS